MILQNLLSLAIDAHRGTSFDPEKRGHQYIRDYSAELSGDLETIAAMGAKFSADPEIIAASSERYLSNYKSWFSAWMSAKGRCMSSMITGPSNFLVARNQKNLDRERSAHENFIQWREKALKAITRRLQPHSDNSPASEVARYAEKLASLAKAQETMKLANKIIRQYGAKGGARGKLVEAGFSEKQADELTTMDSMRRVGFPGYALTNNNAMIKATRLKLAEAQRRAAAANDAKVSGVRSVELSPDGVKVVFNAEADRVQIFHPEKPDAAGISAMKSGAFRWSPSAGCWQRQLTENGVYAAAQALSVEYSELLKAWKS